jgi:outer membrane protein assembly factor BamB
MLFSSVATADNWPTWRGPTANGVVAEGNPPIKWSEKKNIKWKVSVPGRASSTPIIWGDNIFLTTAVPTGKEPENKTEKRQRVAAKPTIPYQFKLLCLDKNTGKLNWDVVSKETIPHEGHHPSSSYAPFSPITDGQSVWVSFGSQGLYCYDIDGNLKWSQELPEMKMASTFGEGSSAAIAGDNIVVLLDHEGDSKIAAYNKATGDPVWEQKRDEESSWTTPIVAEVDGRTQVITPSFHFTYAYDAVTGELIWESEGLGDNAIPMPVVGHGNVYIASGYTNPSLRAIKLGGTGVLNDDEVTAWKVNKNTPYVSSPLLYDDLIYATRGLSGQISVFDALTGEAYYEKEKMEGMKQIYASPIGVANRVYVAGRKGVTAVIEHGKKFKVLATNTLDEGCDGSPVVIGDQLFLKGSEHLYCIAK